MSNPNKEKKKMSKKRNDRITARDVDFAKWYTDVVIQADLIDYAPVKGTMIFKPHGYGIWELIMQTLDAEFKQLGVENVYLPLLIPASLFNQEKEHIEGFAPEVLTVTKVGDKPLEEELYIRPTSEVLFSQYFKNNIHSYRDWPLKNNQWVNVMRWEKTTRPFLRTSEFLWQEGHTMHATSGEADQFALTILNLYAKFVEEYLLIPVIKGTKTINERFAGAKETYTIESLMHDGQALQTGTSHFLGDNFAKVFDIKFQNADGELEYAYGSSWGVSTRMIGALIMTHADDQGLVLPSKVAPVQVQILQLSSESLVQNVVDQLKATLIKDYRVKVDASEKTFGYKMASSEIKGVPIRIEVGMRDVAQEQVVISSRVGDNKTTVKLDQVKTFVDKALITYDQELFKRAKNSLETRIYQAQTLSEYQKGIATQPGLYLVPFCGRVVCEKEIKQKTSTNSRCIPFNHDQSVEPCFNCGQATKIKAYFGRAY